MTAFVRATALLVVVSIAGLSSALVLCVTGCTKQQASLQPHACHEPADDADVTLPAGVPGCPHTPTVLAAGDLTRESRVTIAMVPNSHETPLVISQSPRHIGSCRSAASPPTQTPRSVLRI